MKACIVLQNQYAKLGNAIALNLKNEHGVNNFCTYIFSPGAHEFIKNQKDIDYSSILVDHKLHKLYKKEKLDTEYIKNFEKKYFPPNLWYYLYSDRKLMMSIGPKEETTTEIDPLYNHEDLLKVFQVRAKAIEKMLQEEKPDFILFFAIGTVAHLILYNVAKKLGIKTLNIDFPRIGNSACVSEDYNFLSGVNKKFEEYKKELDNLQGDKYKNSKRFIDNYRKTGSLQLEYYELFMENFVKPKKKIIPKNLYKSLSYLITLSKNYLKNHKLYTYGNTDQNPLRFIGQKIKQRWRGFVGYSKLYSKVDYNEDYAFYGLHYEPELATLLLSPFHFDQINTIRMIARSLPLHYKLYVKEHPAMKNKRKISYYKELNKIPNVKIIDPQEKSFNIIKNSKLIATITGTVGWEACLIGKPVITFGEVFYNSLSFVKRIKNIEELPKIIKEQLDNFSYKNSEMQKFVQAIIDDSLQLNFFDLWYKENQEELNSNDGVKEFCKKVISILNVN